MAKRPEISDPQQIRLEIIQLLQDFELLMLQEVLRPKVLHIVATVHKLRALGISVVSQSDGYGDSSGRDRILKYLQGHVGVVISGDELLVVSGIQEYARRVRELRVQFGWAIVSGEVIKDMVENKDITVDSKQKITVDSYMLISVAEDIEAAYRWNIANTIRKQTIGAREKILQYLRHNVGKNITGDELRYVAGNKTEWARRVRELRTEYAWPIYTRNTGREDLPVGTYVLEEDRQGEVHDRNISDAVRVQVLDRDNHSCRKCGWNRNKMAQGDPRKLLELHHITAHARKGENSAENLITLCNVCHDEIHRLDKKLEWDMETVLNWIGGSNL